LPGERIGGCAQALAKLPQRAASDGRWALGTLGSMAPHPPIGRPAA
jgi:hypothetical protein